MNTLSTTEYGLPLDTRFGIPASAERIALTAQALRERGHDVIVSSSLAAARETVLGALPRDAGVFTMSSETLKAMGIDAAINESGQFVNAVRPRIYAMDFATRRHEIRKLGSSADVVLGSVHAITDDGRMVAASATGSQLALYAFGAGRVIYVVGSQKLVTDLDEAFERIRLWSRPLEDVRFRADHGQPGVVRKTLIIDGEGIPQRSAVVLLPEAVGY